MAHKTVNASEIEPTKGVIRLVRRALGVKAFGIAKPRPYTRSG